MGRLLGFRLRVSGLGCSWEDPNGDSYELSLNSFKEGICRNYIRDYYRGYMLAGSYMGAPYMKRPYGTLGSFREEMREVLGSRVSWVPVI